MDIARCDLCSTQVAQKHMHSLLCRYELLVLDLLVYLRRGAARSSKLVGNGLQRIREPPVWFSVDGSTAKVLFRVLKGIACEQL